MGISTRRMCLLRHQVRAQYTAAEWNKARVTVQIVLASEPHLDPVICRKSLTRAVSFLLCLYLLWMLLGGCLTLRPKKSLCTLPVPINSFKINFLTFHCVLFISSRLEWQRINYLYLVNLLVQCNLDKLVNFTVLVQIKIKFSIILPACCKLSNSVRICLCYAC